MVFAPEKQENVMKTNQKKVSPKSPIINVKSSASMVGTSLCYRKD